MSQSYWLILVFVATMVCNVKCRPRDVDAEKVYPVYRSEKQLEYDTTNRYEKSFNGKEGNESVTYLRIDIPYKNVNTFKTTEKSILINNTKSVIDYVPVALAVKKIHVKKWPSDQNGIESPDDLSLYNIYTNNINPINHGHGTTPNYLDIPHRPMHKPSILILEELTTRRPQYHRPDSVFSQPIQVHNRPIGVPEIPHYPYSPVYMDPVFEKPPLTNPDVVQPLYPQPPITEYYPEIQYPNYPPTTELSIHPTFIPPQQSVPIYIEQTTSGIVEVPTTAKPESTTKKRKKTKCPNVSIVATSSVNNNNILNKEGCQDINIHINTNLNNSVAGPLRPTKTPNNSTVVIQSDQPSQSGGVGIFDLFSAIITRIFNFFFTTQIFSALLAPFSALLTGGGNLSSLLLPWFIPHLLWGKNRDNRLVVVGKEGIEPIKYVFHSLDDNSFYLKRTKRNLGRFRLPFWSWTKKKISSSEATTTKAEHTPEAVNHTPVKVKDTKFDIESIATVARASSDGPSLPSSSAIGHIIDTVGQMVDSDIRTPPKLKEIIKEKANENRRDALGERTTPLPYTFVYEEADDDGDKSFSEGKASHIKVATDDGVKGIAIPVVMEDMDYEPTSPPKKLQKIPEVPKPVKEDKKKNGITKNQPTTTPSSGLSTWILLSDNRDVTTPSPKKNNNKKESNEDKKKTTGTSPTTKKPVKIQATTLKSTSQTNKKATSKPTSGNGKKPENDSSNMSALEAMVKNQKKGVATTQKTKTNEDSKVNSKKPTEPKKKFPDNLEVAETKDKVEIELPNSKVTYTLPTNLPMTNEKGVTVAMEQSNEQSTTENSVEGTTKKKSTTKKKKKNKNRRRKPSSDTGVEAKIPKPPAMGSQIYNFLSREIVPTVGLGLIGVALTAGLASFLGYNPFVSSAVPLRRTYESHHGYTPNNYYNYNTEYGDGGQSEEVLFREVLSGMPEESRYGLTHTDTTYPEAYNRHDQVYDGMKNPAYPTVSGSMYKPEKDVANYDANYPQDYSSGYGVSYDSQDKNYSSDVKEKYPVYNRETGTSFVYPETTGMTSADKVSRGEDYPTQSSSTTSDKYSKMSSDTIERQPEALYRVAGETELQYRNGESTIQGVSSQNNWHRIGSPVDAKKTYPHLEPGPRSLDLSKEPIKSEEKKRVKRGTESVIQRISRKRTKKESDVENEIDFDDSISDTKAAEQNSLEDLSTTMSATKTTTYSAETTTSSEMDSSSSMSTESGEVMSSTTDDVRDASTAQPQDSYETDNESSAPGSSAVSVLDVLKRLAQFKLRLGLNFLRSTTDLFSRYLDDIQRRVDESFTNTTTTTVQYNRRKNPWSRIFFSTLDDSLRRRRSVLKENQFLRPTLTEEDKTNDGYSMKKDLKPSDKIFHTKKTAPKKYESKRTNW